jgi:integrase
MPLTHFDIQNATAEAKPYKLADSGGLFLLIQPNGSKLWRLKYRHHGTERSLSFGPYPNVSLAEARSKRDEAKRLMSEGADPAVRKKLDRIAAETAARNTFGLIVEEFLANLEANGAAPSTMSKNKWLLEDLAKPLANRPIAEITAAEILDLLKRIEKSGRRETARRLRGVMGSVFRLAVVTLRAPTDPTYALQGALLRANSKPRAAITEERKFGALLRAIDDYDGWPTIKAALKFLALTFARPGEVRGARREEILFDKSTWRIPGERTKTRRPHDVPLSRQALDVIQDMWPMSDDGDLLFPSIRSTSKPLSENALNAALRRMGFGPDEMTAHGFRATASTILNEREFNPDVIEAALAHQHENEIRRVYNRAAYWKERVAMMQTWGDLLDEFRALPVEKNAPTKKK